MSDASNINSTSSVVYTGRVKWFNNKAGYGFITVTDSAKAVNGVDASEIIKSGTDVFVHYSKISLANKQYSYLIQGEYVQFQLESCTTGSHTIQASNVTGINGGKLMCETRREFRIARTSYRGQGQQGEGEGDVQTQTQTQTGAPQSPQGPPVPSSRPAPRAPVRAGRGVARTVPRPPRVASSTADTSGKGRAAARPRQA